jgi:hypothetical protein
MMKLIALGGGSVPVQREIAREAPYPSMAFPFSAGAMELNARGSIF